VPKTRSLHRQWVSENEGKLDGISVAKRKAPNAPAAKINGATAAAALDDVAMAMRDLVRDKRFRITDDVIEELSKVAFVALTNALDLRCSEAAVRQVSQDGNAGAARKGAIV
jgi:hypothetical protein